MMRPVFHITRPNLPWQGRRLRVPGPAKPADTRWLLLAAEDTGKRHVATTTLRLGLLILAREP